MKKSVLLLLIAALLLSLAACGTAASSSSGTETQVSESFADTGADEAEEAEEPAEDPKEAAEKDAEEEPAEEEPAAEPADFEEITVVDNDECSIIITGAEVDDIWGYTLNVLLENKSADKTYMFAVEDGSINGLKDDPFFAAEVAAGKKSNEEISFTDLSEYGIDVDDYTDIELSFRVYDSDDWSADDVADETVHVYPYGEDQAAAYVRDSQDSDIVLVDNDDVAVIVTGFEEDDIWGYTANVYLVNKTDKNIMFSVDNTSVNGYMIDPFWATSVSSGKCAYSSMSWSNSDLEENGIAAVEEIEMELYIYDNDDWMADAIFDETVTLNP